MPDTAATPQSQHPLKQFRDFPQIQIRNQNPFYLIETAYSLFDNPEFFPLFRFQETILILSALYQFVTVEAPSQGGKTSLQQLLAAVTAYAYPGCNIGILSTVEDQAERVLREVKERFIDNCRIPELRKLSKDSSTELVIKETGSRIIALPHSIKAVTGWPFRLIILDEIARWTREPDIIYAEAIARLGQTKGQLVGVSSYFGEGRADARSTSGYSGSFFHYRLQQDMKQARNQNKKAIAAQLTYHVSPPLVEFIQENKDQLIRSMSLAGFNEHYLALPRKVAGIPVFQHDFSNKDHLQPDTQLQAKLNYQEPLFICYDPGLTKAAVVGQLDLEGLRLVYLRSYQAGPEVTFEEFVQSTWMRARNAFPNNFISVYADVASKQQNNQTLEQNAEIIGRVTNQWPIMEYQDVTTGIQTMRSFMRRRNGFAISDHPECRLLVEAFESGLVHEERKNVAQEAWVKDGIYDHVGDAARYPVYYLTNGYTADALDVTHHVSAQPALNPNRNPLTGY